jgi:lipoprotein-anchoring transpeptidase ErfK/SrfK
LLAGNEGQPDGDHAGSPAACASPLSFWARAAISSVVVFSSMPWRCVLLLAAATACAQDSLPTESPPPAAAVPAPLTLEDRPVENALEAQVELHRRGFSCGSIDGVAGAQTASALRAFQRHAGIRETGTVDPATREVLRLTLPALTDHVISAAELGQLRPLPPTWLGKSGEPVLAHATALEFIGERYRASPNLLKRLNPGVDWSAVLPGTLLKVPAVDHAAIEKSAAVLNIRLAARELEAFDADGRIVAHFPVSIARNVEKRPVGELRVVVVIPNPNYTFDPEVFPEVPEAKELGRKLILPPGPNNPVGLAWIGLDRPGYGIHGTPDPEKVGRTESHGCFRLANWDALTLLGLVSVGTPVIVEP